MATSDVDTASDAVSARLMHEYLETISANCNLIGVILWDWTDRYQSGDTGDDWWRSGVWDRNLRLKRSRYDALIAGLRDAIVVPIGGVTGRFDSGFDAGYDGGLGALPSELARFDPAFDHGFG